MSKFRVFSHISDPSACSLYRCILPCMYCNKYFHEHNIDISIEIHNAIHFDEFGNYDAYIFHRALHPNVIASVLKLFDRMKKVVWETDDDLHEIPDHNPAKQMFSRGTLELFDLCVGASGKIIVSTDFLASRFHERFPGEIVKTYVLPNLVDYSHFSDHAYLERPRSRVIKVLWTGGNSHREDLNLVADAIKIYKTHKNMNFFIQGEIPQGWKDPHQTNIINIPWAPLPNYVPTLCAIAPDISLIPLVNDVFNKSKSPIKYFETSLAGAACICSDVIPYSDLITNEVDGIIASDDMWKDNLHKLIENRDLRISINENARKKIVRDYSWQTDNPNKLSWVNFFVDLANGA